MLALLAAVANLGAGLYGAAARVQAAGRNRRFANQMAGDVIARGEREAEFAEMDTARVIGSQRASFGAQGIDLTQGSAAAIQAQTAKFGAEDAAQLRLNAAREAWGIRTQARLNYQAERTQALAGAAQSVASFAGDPAARQAGRTLATRAGNAWQRYIGRGRRMDLGFDTRMG